MIIGQIKDGIVLDHITAGNGMILYNLLGLDNLDCQVALIQNAESVKMGRKDIIKVECPVDVIDMDILGYIDHNITVNIIENEQIGPSIKFATVCIQHIVILPRRSILSKISFVKVCSVFYLV